MTDRPTGRGGGTGRKGEEVQGGRGRRYREEGGGGTGRKGEEVQGGRGRRYREEGGRYREEREVCLFVGWLLNVPATCECISGTDLLRQFYVLPH